MLDPLRAIEPALYEDWKRNGRHIEEYASEFAGTAFALVCVVGVVSVFEAKSSAVVAVVPSTGLRLLLIGILLGVAGWLVALSPPGRLSGAHINPAVSFGFWVLGKMYVRDLAGYVGGQVLGAAAGTWLGAILFGRLAREVGNASLRPDPGLSYGLAFAAEAAATFVLTFAIYTCVSYKPLVRWTPAVATVMVGVLVWLDGAYSGAGMNPARWFGPALSIDYWRDASLYVAGPIAGAILAAGLRRSGLFLQPVPHTAKIFHDPSYRSVFKNDTVLSAPPGLDVSGARNRSSGR